MKVLLVHPGARWATADVEAGIRYGLEAQGVTVERYRLDTRLTRAKRWLYRTWHAARDASLPRPTSAEALLHAGLGALEQALRHQVDAVIVVSAILLHPDVIVLLKRAGLRVYAVFTESPYDSAHELRIAALVDGCWTHERTMVDDFKAINPNSWYLPHAWHPERHFVTQPQYTHDVVFVGSGFPERVTFFNAIDWTGINLGLYGIWKGFGLKPDVEACVKGGPIDNADAAAIYRRSKIGLNLYRRCRGHVPESLNPRAYELAACGVFSICQHRAESAEKFGDSVPMFGTPAEAERLIRKWLPVYRSREVCADSARSVIRGDSWVSRATQMLEHMGVTRPIVARLSTPSDARFFTSDADVPSKIPVQAYPDLHWHAGTL